MNERYTPTHETTKTRPSSSTRRKIKNWIRSSATQFIRSSHHQTRSVLIAKMSISTASTRTHSFKLSCRPMFQWNPRWSWTRLAFRTYNKNLVSSASTFYWVQGVRQSKDALIDFQGNELVPFWRFRSKDTNHYKLVASDCRNGLPAPGPFDTFTNDYPVSSAHD